MFSSRQTNTIIVVFCLSMLLLSSASYFINQISNQRLLDDTPKATHVFTINNVTVDETNPHVYLDANLTTIWFYTRNSTPLYYYTAYNPIRNETVYFNSDYQAFCVVPGK